MILGLDHGFGHTKGVTAQKRIIFKSAYDSNNSLVKDAKSIIINGKSYVVGSGESCNDPDKVNTNLTIVETVYSMCANGEGVYDIVCGVPIDSYEKLHVKMADQIRNINKFEVDYLGKPFRFNIRNVFCYKQGLGILYLMNSVKNCIICDIGSLTWDICQVETTFGNPELTRKATYYTGLKTLYKDIVNAVVNEKNIILKPEQAEAILLNGLSIDGKNVNLDFLKPVLMSFLKPIVSDIKTDFSTSMYPIIFHGGGSLLLYNILKTAFPNSERIEDPVYGNANAYYRMGCMMWGSDDEKGGY